MSETGKKYTKQLLDEQIWLEADIDDLWVYDKLLIAKKQGLLCGPSGMNIPKTGHYVVRPIMNINGMGVGASIVKLAKGDCTTVPDGYFFVEKINKPQYSITYVNCEPVSSYQAHRDPTSPLYKFDKWTKSDVVKPYPKELLGDLNHKYSHINVEWMGPYVIEVHLRGSPDPECQEFVPVWESDLPIDFNGYYGYKYINAPESAGGKLDNPRVGFFVKENK